MSPSSSKPGATERRAASTTAFSRSSAIPSRSARLHSASAFAAAIALSFTESSLNSFSGLGLGAFSLSGLGLGASSLSGLGLGASSLSGLGLGASSPSGLGFGATSPSPPSTLPLGSPSPDSGLGLGVGPFAAASALPSTASAVTSPLGAAGSAFNGVGGSGLGVRPLSSGLGATALVAASSECFFSCLVFSPALEICSQRLRKNVAARPKTAASFSFAGSPSSHFALLSSSTSILASAAWFSEGAAIASVAWISAGAATSSAPIASSSLTSLEAAAVLTAGTVSESFRESQSPPVASEWAKAASKCGPFTASVTAAAASSAVFSKFDPPAASEAPPAPASAASSTSSNAAARSSKPSASPGGPPGASAGLSEGMSPSRLWRVSSLPKLLSPKL
mmetsp:Transcript_17472/g.31100  ORF Transcript_17472/g.31100 Transcript_17472/m.31100 type:complete len:394 (+) Transcript_17472:1565-2746(+)